MSIVDERIDVEQPIHTLLIFNLDGERVASPAHVISWVKKLRITWASIHLHHHKCRHTTNLEHEIHKINVDPAANRFAIIRFWSYNDMMKMFNEFHGSMVHGRRTVCKLVEDTERHTPLPVPIVARCLNHYLGFDRWSTSILLLTKYDSLAHAEYGLSRQQAQTEQKRHGNIFWIATVKLLFCGSDLCFTATSIGVGSDQKVRFESVKQAQRTAITYAIAKALAQVAILRILGNDGFLQTHVYAKEGSQHDEELSSIT